MEKCNPWNSLEIIKLIANLITPMVVIIIGYFINKRLSQYSHLQWNNQKLIEKKIAIFDVWAPKLNDLLCYYLKIGNWKELSPVQIIQTKREVDKIRHVNAALFSEKLLNDYEKFIVCCFKTFSGVGEDAKIRARVQGYRDNYQGNWDDEWNKLFDDNNAEEKLKIEAFYNDFMDQFSLELGSRNS